MMPGAIGSSPGVNIIFDFCLNIPTKIEMIYSVTEWTWPRLEINWVAFVGW